MAQQTETRTMKLLGSRPAGTAGGGGSPGPGVGGARDQAPTLRRRQPGRRAKGREAGLVVAVQGPSGLL